MEQRIVPRSWLSVPASRPELIAKALNSESDAVIIDLEDAVAPAEKDAARAALARTLPVRRRPLVVVRVNAPGTPWSHLDLEACAVPGGPDGVMVPKSEGAGDICFVERLLTGASRHSGRDRPPMFYALLESAAGIAAAREIAAASPLLRGLAIGYADLAASLGRGGGRSWLYAQDAILTAARAYGLDALDGPHLGVAVDAEFDAACRAATELGFDGKWVIHPRQVPTVNAHFTPDDDAVAEARAIVDALDAQHARGIGAFTRNGRMIDDAVAVLARRTLARARANSQEAR